jgi:hypothetical protein
VEGIFLIAILILIFFLATSNQKTTAKRKAMVQHLSNVNGFTASQQFISLDTKSGIAINAAGDQICLIRSVGKETEFNVFSTQYLVSSELQENGNSISKISRKSQLGGALLGGLAFGGVGAVIGSLSGSSTSTEQIFDIRLHVTLDRLDGNIYDIKFHSGRTKKGSLQYTQLIQEAQKWQGLMDVLIRRFNRSDTSIDHKAISAKNLSSDIDELTKISTLRKDGTISEVEFLALKAKIIARTIQAISKDH